VALADIEDDLARREAARFAAGKTLRRLDLSRIEYGKKLVTARLRKAHRMAPLRGTRAGERLHQDAGAGVISRGLRSKASTAEPSAAARTEPTSTLILAIAESEAEISN